MLTVVCGARQDGGGPEPWNAGGCCCRAAGCGGSVRRNSIVGCATRRLNDYIRAKRRVLTTVETLLMKVLRIAATGVKAPVGMYQLGTVRAHRF